LHVPEVNVILMMNIDGKGEQEDLSSDRKVVLKALADHSSERSSGERTRGRRHEIREAAQTAGRAAEDQPGGSQSVRPGRDHAQDNHRRIVG
jgi:hypothetical protein